MRYTLSVLTAACLLALGQPAWSDTFDRELLQRARTAALALPDQDRACASLWLQQLLTSAPAPAASVQRTLPFHTRSQAVHQTLRLHYATMGSTHVLAHPTVQTHWHLPSRVATSQHPRMLLDSAMVQRWIAPWQQEAA